jgi:hypothetical protein
MRWPWENSVREKSENSSSSVQSQPHFLNKDGKDSKDGSKEDQLINCASLPDDMSAIPGQPSDHIGSSDSDSETRAPAKRGHSIAPLQDSMNCRQAFDEAMYCSFLGSHFNNIYRYGQFKECSEKWSDFWFCARMRSYPQAEKEQTIRDRFRKKEEKYISGPSSEDVWESRSRPVGKAFDMDPDAEGIFENSGERNV